ncbi:MAG: hypothetical protein UIH27_08635, partial [Ruminococcus sp.]|nr:hypothetical protein [Ruminococcus sp.]
GFAANFLGPFAYYIFWTRISKTPFSLRSGKDLLKQTAVTVVSAVAQAALITPAVELIYPDVKSMVFASTVLLNDTIFPLLLGIPLMILMQEELTFNPLLNRKSSANK